MEKDYLSIDGRSCRVVVNWNAISDYCDKKGVTNLAELDALAQFTPKDLLPMAHACIKEGERMEGNDFSLSEKELGAVLSVMGMTQFAQIYTRQTVMSVQDTTPGKKKQ